MLRLSQLYALACTCLMFNLQMLGSCLIFAITLLLILTQATTQEMVPRINCNYMMMIRWICSTNLTDKIISNELRSRLGLCSIENVLRREPLCCYSRLQCMDPDIWPRKFDKTIVTGSNPRGCPWKTQLECIRNDLTVEGLEASLAQNRTAWRWPLNSKKRLGRGNEAVQPLDTGNNPHQTME